MFNLESVEKQFYKLSPNHRYALRHKSDIPRYMSRLYAERVKNVNDEYTMETVIGGTRHSTTLVIDYDGNYKSSRCTCEYHRKNEPCGHVLLLAQYCFKNSIEPPYAYEDSNSSNIFTFYSNAVNSEEKEKKIYDSEEWIKNIIDDESVRVLNEMKNIVLDIEPYIYEKKDYINVKTQEIDEYGNRKTEKREIQKLYLKFKIGYDRKYVISNISEKLLLPLDEKEVVYFGKNLQTKMDIELFNDFSKKQIGFIKNNERFISGGMLELNQFNIDEFCDLYSESGNFDFKESDFEFELRVREDDFMKNHMVILFKDVYYMKYIISSNRAVKYNNQSGAIEVMEINALDEKLLNNINCYRKSFILEEKRFADFIKFIETRVSAIRITSSIESIHDKDKDDESSFNHEMSESDFLIKCDIGDSEEIIVDVVYKRDFPDTSLFSVVSVLKNTGFEEFGKLYEKCDSTDFPIEVRAVIWDNDRIDDFLEYALPLLRKHADIYLSEVLKNLNRPRKINLSVGVKVKSNLLEFSISSDELDRDELYEVLSVYRRRKKFYRMKNGERIQINSNQFVYIDEFFKSFKVEDKDIKKAKFTVPKYRIYQVENLGNEYFNLDIDEKFSSLFTFEQTPLKDRFYSLLRNYQIDGVKWLLKLRKMGLGGILADDMGLGKTIQVIAYLESITLDKPAIIVTPASLVLNWEHEFKKFNSNLDILTVYGDAEKRKKAIENITNQVVITSYDYLKRDIDCYSDIEFDTIVIDEAQYIKNHKTKAARSVKSLDGDNKIALSGTPIENTLSELWSMFDFLMPGYLYSYNYFSRNYEKPVVSDKNSRAAKNLKSMVEPFILRRLKKDVLHELPDKVEETYYVEMNDVENRLYNANVLSITDRLRDMGEEKTNKFEVLSMLTRLRQICIDPRLLYDDILQPSSKVDACMEIVETSIENGKKILLFSAFTSVLELIEYECSKRGISYYSITGETDKRKRQEQVDRFQKDDTPLFLISLKAGGTGLNLTSASVVIHIDPWWNKSAQNQATDRTYRIGQKNNVQVFNLISKGTIEEKIQELQESKKELNDIFVENSEGSFAQMSKNDIIELFR